MQEPLIVPNSNLAYGRVRALQYSDQAGAGYPLIMTLWKRNTVVYEWATIVGKLLTTGDRKYRIGGMYLEFENTTSPGDAVTIPTYDRTRNVEYYNALSGDPKRDYLRVPVTSSLLNTTDEALFPYGNAPTFFARSQGLVGVHGKTFSSANNSKVFGASLVALVHATDATQDLILSTFYFDTADQQPKLATSQIGIQWELPLG